MSNRTYIILYVLVAVIAVIGLFIPLMDNDAAHHANIAMRMYLTGDYVNLIDNGAAYLDKPHLHFWLAALSYELFGVNGFAYKFPSLIISIGGVYSVYRLAKLLFDSETGKLAALILATSFAFLLSVNDVRMDAILVSAISFSCWQLSSLLLNKNWWNVLGAALGLAVGFSVKGSIGLIVPIIYLFWLLLEKRKGLPAGESGRAVPIIKWLVLPLFFFLLIAPVLYCYYLQFNLHPETTVRGRDHINGLRFILFGQGMERISGQMSGGSADPFFFIYTFLWAFAPWSLFVYLAIFKQFKEKKNRFLAATLISIALLTTISGSKLPHYLNICFPFAAVMAASYLQGNLDRRITRILLYVLTAILLASALLLDYWVFPMHSWMPAIIVFILFVPPSMLTGRADKQGRPLLYTSVSMLFLFLSLNANFYPSLLEYQGGQELAAASRGKVDPQRVYFWKNNYSSSYCFASKQLRQEFSDTVLIDPGPAWIIYDNNYREDILANGYSLSRDSIAVKDFEITKLDKQFLDPRTREGHCSKLVIRRIGK